MSLPFSYTSNQESYIRTGSYMNEQETNMFVSGYSTDLWYGLCESDTVEVSLFDLNQNLLGWTTIYPEKKYKTVNLTYFDVQNKQISYSYNEFISDFILHKNSNILVNPVEDLSSSFGITEGSYLLTYNFTREMAGNSNDPLIIKDISPSRTEVKLIPVNGNNSRYEAFCKKKLLIKDVSSLLILATKQCPYDEIYSSIKDKYLTEIAFLKQLLFLDTDAGMVRFLKMIYEDWITEDTFGSIKKQQRIQGIRTYYQNFLLSNYETLSDFSNITTAYNTFTSTRIEQQFSHYGIQKGQDFVKAKQFLIDFFTTNFYQKLSDKIESGFKEKFYSYFQNALNLGQNQFFTIVDHSYLDERIAETDPLTLLLKIKDGLSSEIKIQTLGWISNISIAPFIANIILRQTSTATTVKIGVPNFDLEKESLSLYNTNVSFTADDLEQSSFTQRDINISKNINELAIDYSDFKNFVIYSSAVQRVNNFKKKISSWYMLSASLVSLDFSASQSIVNGVTYPQYVLERGSLDGQMREIVNSFDGYESHLFRTGSYGYDTSNLTWVNSSYVEEQDTSASFYDKNNLDSLIINSPEHIVLDDSNQEYLTFLNMIGHFFDNIYIYIANLPSEKIVSNNPTKTLSKKMVDYMLDSFGWKVGNAYEDVSVTDAYVASTTASLSQEDRTKAIRTRILSNLPYIYKTKGTSEAVKLLTSCYGIPVNLMDVREYGNNQYASSSLVTYTKRERSCLIGISGSYAGIIQSYGIKPSVRTVEFKLILEHPEVYTKYKEITLVSDYEYYFLNVSGGFFTPYRAWEIGFWKEYGNMGRIYAKTGIGSPSLTSSVYLTSSLLPILDGEIFNIRLRRNTPDQYFETWDDEDEVPTIYDLTIQRNESGRRVFRSFNSNIGSYADNKIWDGTSVDLSALTSTTTSSIHWVSPSNPHKVYLALGNAMVWDVPISDADFEVHCNDFSSFAYSGSNRERHLIARMDADEPTNFISRSVSGNASGYIPNKSEYYSTYHDLYWQYIISNSFSGSSTTLYGKSPMPNYFRYMNSRYTPLNVTYSISSDIGCHVITHSLYPYEYVVKDLEKVYTTPSYGPNRFRNEKVNLKSQNLDVRLDDKERSTYERFYDIESDSNLLGVYLDPQDAKNRDIVKFNGNHDLMELIADPKNMYSSSYADLKTLNDEYNSFGDRRVLYNELITLYKIYFNRSIFDAVKNLIPARVNLRTGILVEPTVLERPKYQHKKIETDFNSGSAFYYDVSCSHYAPGDTITKLVRFSGSLENTSDGQMDILWGETNVDTSSISTLNTNTLPSNPTMNYNLGYITEANFVFPQNLNGGYIPDLMDDIQFGNYGSLGNFLKYSEAIGLTDVKDMNKIAHSYGGNYYFLVKQWNRYNISYKSGSYIRNSFKPDDFYSTCSVWLYKLIALSEIGYNRLFYTSSANVIGDMSETPMLYPYYWHNANTAKGTPNQKINTIKGTTISVGISQYAGLPLFDIKKDSYYEVFGGYPRNHYTHKRMLFSPERFLSSEGKRFQSTQIYTKGRQTVATTVDEISGLEDGSLPIQSIEISNVNLVKSDNVINQ